MYVSLTWGTLYLTHSVKFVSNNAKNKEYNVWEYIYSCFEALNITGAGYIVNDIDMYIETRCYDIK